MENDNCRELPDHLIHEIFLILPAKTLLRFRSLSKEWNKIISNPVFGKLHYNLFNTGTSISTNIFAYFFSPKIDKVVQFTITDDSIASLSRHSSCSFPSSIAVPLPIQIRLSCSYRRVLYISHTSCHGMLCFRFFGFDCKSNDLLIWNLTTRQYRQVPCLTPVWEQSFFGVAYDDANDDYKIVLKYVGRSACIMSLKNNDSIWRTIDTPSWGMPTTFCQNSATIDGDIFWISYISTKDINKDYYYGDLKNHSEEDRIVVLKFNITSERLTILPPPLKEVQCMDLLDYKGSLYLISYSSDAHCHEHWANIWILRHASKKGGVLWNKVMDLPYLPFVKYRGRKHKLGFTTSGDLIFTSSSGIFVYLTQEERYVEMPLDGSTFSSALYVSQNESLISPVSINSSLRCSQVL